MRIAHLTLQFARLSVRQGPRAALRATVAKISRLMLRLSGYELATLEQRMSARLSQTVDALAEADRRTQERIDLNASALTEQSSAIAEQRAILDALRNEVAHVRCCHEATERTLAGHRAAVDSDTRRLNERVHENSDSLRHLTHLTRLEVPALPSCPTGLRISVIIPVHNRALQVRAAIDSVLAQRYPEFELIVVDDGSTDGLNAALAPYARRPHVRILSLAHGGENRARNAGLEAATGDLIVNLDSDNLMCPGYLERLSLAYASAPDAQCGLAAILWDDGDTKVHLRHDHFAWDGVLEGRVGIDTNAFSFRTRVWQELGGWDESLTRLSDFDLALRYTRRYPPLRVQAVAAYYDFRAAHDRISSSRALHPNSVRIRARYRPAITRPLRVLIICYDYPQLSESYVDTEVAWMTRQGVEVAVCSMALPEAPGVATVPVHRDGPERAIADFRPDLLHCHWLHLIEPVAALAREHGLPLTVRGHGFEFTAEALAACEAHGVARRIYLFPHLATQYGVGRPVIKPTAACFNSQRFYPRQASKDRRMVFRAAACLATKDIDSFFHIAAACPDYRFVLALTHIAARPLLPAHFEALNQSLGGPVDIRWDVPYDDIADLYAQAGVYLHTFGFAETFGMPVSIAESMACGAIPLLRECEAARAYAGDCALYYHTPQQAIAHLNTLSQWGDEQWRAEGVRCAEHAFLQCADEIVLPAILQDWLELTDPAGKSAQRTAIDTEAKTVSPHLLAKVLA